MPLIITKCYCQNGLCSKIFSKDWAFAFNNHFNQPFVTRFVHSTQIYIQKMKLKNLNAR